MSHSEVQIHTGKLSGKLGEMQGGAPGNGLATHPGGGSDLVALR